MRVEWGKHKAKMAFLILSSFCLAFCGKYKDVEKLRVEEGKKFEKLSLRKVWQSETFGGWCLALPQGIICTELLDRSWRESRLKLYDYTGELKKERKLIHGDGPNEIRVWNFNTVWVSSSGKVLSEDNNYLKALDPETLEIETVCKLSNVIGGYGGKYTFGRQSFSSLEECDGRTVTSFESPAYFEDLTYYIVLYDGIFENLSILARAKKPKPLTWQKLDERKRQNGKIESIIDYYHLLRLTRILSVDWKRQVVYFISDIEKPWLESVDFLGKNRKAYEIDINIEGFKVDREEFDFWHEYTTSETDPRLKGGFTEVLYIPPHAPALMGIKIIGDRLFIITGNRDWEKRENEVLTYSLPSLRYEGSFFIPFPNLLLTQWYDKYYITRTLIKKNDDYCSFYEIYQVEER